MRLDEKKKTDGSGGSLTRETSAKNRDISSNRV